MKTKIYLIVLALSAVLLFGCKEEIFIDEPGNLVPRTVDQNSALPSITVNGALLHSEAFGHPDSTMIVVIHGGPGSDYRALLNIQDLANYGYRVIFYDQIGSGLSQRFSKSYYTSMGKVAVDLMYDELRGVISHYRRNSSQKVFLIGDSWGAIMATGYAGKFPNAVNGIILSEPGGFKWRDIMEYSEKSRAFNFFSEGLNDVTYLDQFITANGDQHEILDYKAMMLGSKNEITGEDNLTPGSIWRAGYVINRALFEVGEKYEPDFSEGISNFNGSALLFISEKNEAYQEAWANKITGVFNSIEIVKCFGVGHSGMYQNKDAWKNSTLPKLLNYLNANQ